MQPGLDFFIFTVLNVVIGGWMGSKRKMGAIWGIFFCVTFSFFFGIIIMLASRKATTPSGREIPSLFLRISAFILMIIGMLVFFSAVNSVISPHVSYYENASSSAIYTFSLAIGIMGAGFYIIYPYFENKKQIDKE